MSSSTLTCRAVQPRADPHGPTWSESTWQSTRTAPRKPGSNWYRVGPQPRPLLATIETHPAHELTPGAIISEQLKSKWRTRATARCRANCSSARKVHVQVSVDSVAHAATPLAACTLTHLWRGKVALVRAVERSRSHEVGHGAVQLRDVEDPVPRRPSASRRARSNQRTVLHAAGLEDDAAQAGGRAHNEQLAAAHTPCFSMSRGGAPQANGDGTADFCASPKPANRRSRAGRRTRACRIAAHLLRRRPYRGPRSACAMTATARLALPAVQALARHTHQDTTRRGFAASPNKNVGDAPANEEGLG